MLYEEKCELLKETIFQLYSKEGRSKNYISGLLKINRKVLSSKIDEWGLPVSKPQKQISPSVQKFINKNKTFIKARLNENVSVSEISKLLHVDRKWLTEKIIENDTDLKTEYKSYLERRKQSSKFNKEEKTRKSSRNYNYDEIEGEEWKEILGYPGYEVSNKGRIRSFSKTYDKYYLLNLEENVSSGRMYVVLYSDGKKKNIQVSRLVGFTFVNGYSEINDTINHKDGNVKNNAAENLEWVSQSKNNEHAYSDLKRKSVNKRRFIFSKIIYKNKYEFKTVSAFARFLNKSETQTRRYLENPEKYDIELIK